MVNRLRLNEKSVREAEPAKGRDYQIFDTDVRGFAVCIYRSGGRAFTIDYRHAGRQRRMTIGRWPEWSTTAARERAKELRREIDAGGDPLGQKETGRDAPRFKDLIDRYTEVHLPHLSALNASDQKSMLAKMVAPDWGNKLVTEITPYDVEKLLNKVALGRARPSKAKPNNRARKLQGSKPTPVRANRTGEVLRKMFTYAVSWGWRDDNPASGFRRRIENPRERFLSHEEIRKLAEALEAAEDRRAAGIIRLCMLTGARVGEVRQARFEHFNLEHLSWSKPASMTKQRKVHRLPISDEAAAIVRQRLLLVPRGCPLLFPGDVPGQPVKEIRRFWMAIQKVVGIPVHGANGIIGWTNKVLYSHGVPLVTCRGSNCGMVLWAEGPLWVSNNSMAILPSGDLDLRFIYYNLLNSPPLEFVSGSAQPQITMGDLSKKAFLVPPLREQRAIATTLGALDDKIELNRKMNATLEAMARALFRDWFVDFGPTRAKMKARAPYLSPDLWSLFPDRLDDEGKPEGWTVRTLGDVADQIAMGPFGSNIKVETFVAEGIPVISGAHLRGLQLADKDYNFITEVHADKLRRSNVRRSDIVFTHAGNIGQVAIIPETAEFDRYVISQRQ